MPNKSHEEINQYYFKKFRKDYPLPLGTAYCGDKPDVILECERRIGIEITNFFREEGDLLESEQVQGKLREQVLSEAQRIYQDLVTLSHRLRIRRAKGRSCGCRAANVRKRR